MELTYYDAYSYPDGPLADTDLQNFSKCTYSLGKLRRLLSQRLVLSYQSVISAEMLVSGQCRNYISGSASKGYIVIHNMYLNILK